ncbi:MAG: PAS domain-containing protein [Rhodothermus sp.]|nr:PAS domain-containing protein [Rhodothermus sp.]
MQSMVRGGPEPALLVVDREGIVRAISPGHVHWLGPRRHRLLGHPWWGVVHRTDLKWALHHMRRVWEGTGEPQVWQVRVRTGAGRWCRVQMTAMLQDDGLVRLLLRPVQLGT